MLAAALVILVPTTADLGLTWDEPAYRTSQLYLAAWVHELGQAASWPDWTRLWSRDALWYYWPYNRFGYNFHPPLGGVLNATTAAVFGRSIDDIVARRLASVLEFAAAAALLAGWIGRRSGPIVGMVAAGVLLTMPRLYGHAHIAGTDMPMLVFWAAAALAFWNGLQPGPGGRSWRVAFGVLVGLCFLVKLSTVLVVVPAFGWLAVHWLIGAGRRIAPRGAPPIPAQPPDPSHASPRTRLRAAADFTLMTTLLGLPLLIVLAEVVRLAKVLPPPQHTDLYRIQIEPRAPAWLLALPLVFWLIRLGIDRRRRAAGRVVAVRPGVELWSAMLALAPVVAIALNPSWWHDTLVRLAHYDAISLGRQAALPDIQIFYLGKKYLYSLPWPNAYVLMAVTIPAATLGFGLVGCGVAVGQARCQPVKLYFLVQMLTLPVVRMLPTPAHDGVRLFLPAFFFWAGLAAWGIEWLARRMAAGLGRSRAGERAWIAGLGAAVVVAAGFDLASIHPYELSYYNRLVGGLPGAERRGFEVSYWYDALNPRVLAELNRRFDALPGSVVVALPDPAINPETFAVLAGRGKLSRHVELFDSRRPGFPFVWLLTHQSKATPFTRLMFALTPWYFDATPGVRVFSVYDAVGVSRAWALWMLVDATDGAARPPRARTDRTILDIARTRPEAVREAARLIRRAGPRRLADRALLAGRSAAVQVVAAKLLGQPAKLQRLLRDRPEALGEAAEIVIRRHADLGRIVEFEGYTPRQWIGGSLDDARSLDSSRSRP